jgi:uncharacterized protein YjdB
MRTFMRAVTGLVFGVAACSSYGTSVVDVQNTPAKVASVSVLIPVSLVAGQTARATATPKDANGNALAGRPVLWYTSSPAIASVTDSGVISAVAPGQAVVSAISDGISGQATMSVSPPPPSPVASVAVSLNPSVVAVGQTAQATAIAQDSAGRQINNATILWDTSDPTVASVDATGKVTAIKAGTSMIKASSGSKSNASPLTVNAPAPVPVSSVVVSPTSASLQVGAKQQLSAATRDANGNALTGRSVSWNTSNSAIATVSQSGLVTAVAAGTVSINASSEGQSGSSSITVTAPPPPAPVATVAVSPTAATVTAGNTQQLSATMRDAGGTILTGRVVSWSSADNSIASVNSSSGLVTGVAAGTVQVTATSEGKTGSSAITVTAPPPPPPPGSSNEPAGMTMIADRPFNSLQENPWDTDNTLSIVQDPTAPKSPSSVIRVTFPTGFAGGSSNGHTGMQWSGGQRILYASYWMKYSSNWWGHNTGINKQAYAWVNEGGGYTPFVMEAEGSGSGPLKPRPILQRMIVGDGNYEPNLVPNATITRGQWFHIEVVLTGNTSGSANGAMDIYLDGVHVTSVGGLQWTNGTTAWNIFELYPVWGGIGDVVPATMTADWDHVYLSGK